VFNFFESERIVMDFFSFPLVKYFWFLGLLVSYVLFYHGYKVKDGEETRNLTLVKGFAITIIFFLSSRTFISEQYVLYLIPFLIILKDVKFFKITWLLTSLFLFLNYFPFSFSYLIDIFFWKKYLELLASSIPSVLRLIGLSISAITFDFFILTWAVKETRGWMDE
jgi:hypothetical protein